MKRRVWLLLLLALLLAGIWWWYSGLAGIADGVQQARLSEPPPLAVAMTTAQRRPIPLQLAAIGTVEPVQTVAIRPQVGGVLQQIAFSEGDYVNEGDLLFVIDPRPYEAALAEAQATLEHDQAALANARAEYERLAPLSQGNYVSKSELSKAQAAAKQAAASVAADQARLDMARIELGYTRIHAPIDGRTGVVALDVGNVVDANGATPLVTVNQMAPINVRFTVPQTQLAALRKYQQQGPIAVAIDPDDGMEEPVAGRLVFIDNSVAPETGTITLKAQADNEDGRLWPGQFVRVTVVLTVQQKALTVPMLAVQPSQDGSYVFRVEDGVAYVQPVTVAREQDGLAVISAGLQAGDVVIPRVPRNLANGSRVTRQADGEAGPDLVTAQPEPAPG